MCRPDISLYLKRNNKCNILVLGRNNKDIHLLNSSVFGFNKNNVIDKKYKEVRRMTNEVADSYID